MTAEQLAFYRTLRGIDARAAYLVRIGDARNFSEACRQMAARRGTLRKVREVNDRLEDGRRGRAVGVYFD